MIENDPEIVIIKHIKRRKCSLMEVVRSSNQAFKDNTKACEEKLREQQKKDMKDQETKSFIDALCINESVKAKIRENVLCINEYVKEKNQRLSTK